MNIYSPSDHPRCRLVFLHQIWRKVAFKSLAHQWMLCSEWVPSKWESKQLIKHHNNPQVIHLISIRLFLDSHSDGTHSLQSIHWWASDLNATFLQTWWRNKLIFILDSIRVHTFSANVHFWVKSWDCTALHVFNFLFLHNLLEKLLTVTYE